MNLAVARSFQRSKEVGMRKVVGAKKGQLVKQFFSESITFALLALAVSVIIVMLTLPAFNNFIQRSLSFNPLKNPQLFPMILAVILFVGLIAGSYPAFYISSFRPVEILRNSFIRSSKGVTLRKLLIAVQFSIAIVLIITSLVIRDQLNFIKNKDMGYNKEQIIVLHVGDIGVGMNVHNNIEAIKTELLRNTDIITVACTKRLPNNITIGAPNILPGKVSDEYLPITAFWTDDEFIDLFGLKIVEGRNFSREFPSDAEGAILINESAAKASKWKSPIGKVMTYWGNRKGVIVGILKDFHFHLLHRQIEPLCIYYEPLYFDYICIKIDAVNIPGTIAFIGKIMKKFSPKYPFEYQFFDEIFDNAYSTENKLKSLFSIFTFIAILIACLGLIGLTSFTTEQRTKEIGIRKALGARVSDIVLLLSWEFIMLVLIANTVAWPIAYFIITKWLHNFAYKIDIELWTFLFSAVLAFCIALFTVSFQSMKAARTNPVDSLKYE